MKHYQTIIIGFGKGGKSLAHSLASQNETVALIEKDPSMYGGTCINVGCIPTKAINHSALRAPQNDFKSQQDYYQQAIQVKLN